MVGGGDEPEIRLDDRVAANPFEHFSLQDAQQLGLHFKGQIADFVQEDRPLVGQFEFAGFAGRAGTGESAALVAEEFGFEEVLGNRGAIDLDERVDRPGAGVVNALGEKFLARAALTGNQYRIVVGGRHQGVLLQVGDRPAAADDALQRVMGRAQADLFFLVAFELGFQRVHPFGQLDHFAHILEHDQAEYGDYPAFSFYGEPIDDDVLSADHLHVIDFGPSGAGDDMHAAALHQLGAVLADAVGHGDAQKVGIGFVQVGDDAIGIGHDRPVVNAVENQLKQFQLILNGLKRFGFRRRHVRTPVGRRG
ncbi:hypothetical protein DESC_610403 [Desulfosarcina cetonica]|nr:hypothetical protein DESC_610403 [Desulfosarcina cetonica]